MKTRKKYTAEDYSKAEDRWNIYAGIFLLAIAGVLSYFDHTMVGFFGLVAVITLALYVVFLLIWIITKKPMKGLQHLLLIPMVCFALYEHLNLKDKGSLFATLFALTIVFFLFLSFGLKSLYFWVLSKRNKGK